MYYYSLNNYYKERFGEKIYKLSISADVTCPNRDGTIGNKGCIFCSADGSGEFSAKGENINSQIEQAKLLVNHKNKNGKYVAYFQSFTNTYAPINYLDKIFTQAINHNDIVGLAIATRPDCLGDEVLALLNSLNKIKPVFVELGFQTSNENTALYIRRGYKNDCYINAVNNLKSLNINVVTHIILGLPYESKEDMLNTVKFISEHKTDGIKIHLLHILKNTDLEKDYNNKLFNTLELYEYIDILCNCIEILPKDIVIHRLTGDGPKKLLIAPLWSGDKKRVLNAINIALSKRNIVQGSKYIKNF